MNYQPITPHHLYQQYLSQSVLCWLKYELTVDKKTTTFINLICMVDFGVWASIRIYKRRIVVCSSQFKRKTFKVETSIAQLKIDVEQYFIKNNIPIIDLTN